MLFNSFTYLFFLPIVFFGYWFLFQRNLKLQNFFILVVSCVFYGWWDYRFLSLIFLSSIIDYVISLKLLNTLIQSQRKILLMVSLIANLGLLGFFKYYNFFIESFSELLVSFGFQANISTLNIILPVGISFYTFQTLSYTIDVYRGTLKPTRDFIQFFAFVSYFPQLVAGPIERASNLLPQFEKKRTFNYDDAKDGMRQILWGLFKKMVIADNCAIHVNSIFSDYENLPGSVLVVGAIYFAFQIYGDFSGYSDIAIGTSRLFGIKLMRNFAYPYFSRSISEFWRRWHISLTTWFRDYVYFPLGGSQGTKSKTIRNTIIIFVVSGFWHGANWTFVFWGLLNAILFIPSLIRNTNRKHLEIVANNSIFPSIRELFQIGITFVLVAFTWIIFRAETMSDAIGYIKNIFSSSIFTPPLAIGITLLFPLILFMLIFEFIHRKKEHGLSLNVNLTSLATWPIYYLILTLIFWFNTKPQGFIYFQF